MQQVKAITKQIAGCHAEVSRLEGERERCNAAITGVEYHPIALHDLRERRAIECAQAFIEQRKANVVELDKEIAAAEKVLAPAREQAAAARGAVALIEERLAAIGAEIEQLMDKRRGLIRTELEARREIAIDEYVEAVEALASIFAKMVSADRLIRKVDKTAVVHQLPGETLLARLRLERLPIPWDRSGKKPPLRGARGWAPGTYEAAEPYMKFEPVLAAPAWLHDDSLIDASLESLAGELRAAGVDGI